MSKQAENICRLIAGIALLFLVEHALAKDKKVEPLTGYFAYEGGSERYDVAIYLTVRDEGKDKLSIALMAAHPDAHGAAPDGDGEGTIDADGKLRFDYEDSFFNKGTGTFKRTKDGYLLSIQIDHYEDRRCSFFYGEHLLHRNPAEKHPAGIKADEATSAGTNALLGEFRVSDRYEKEMRIIIRISIMSAEGGYRLGFQGMGDGGRGHAPEGNGHGQIGQDGVLRFEFHDSFLNDGSGTFRKAGNAYVLHIDISKISIPDVMMFYGEDIPMRRE